MTQNTWPYRVDGELGRFEFPTYRVCQQETTLYDTAREVFPPLGCWERYETTGFKEIALIRGVTEQSYLKTATWLNRIRHQEGATGSTTLRNSVEREGKKLREVFGRVTTDILRREGVDETGQPVHPTPMRVQEPAVIPTEQVTKVMDACELATDARVEVEQNPVLYEQCAVSVNISIDDVVVKQQKRHRTSPHEQDEISDEEERTGRKYVHTPVAHLQHQEQSSCITGQGVPVVLRIVLGYLLTNALMGRRY
ncbi:MAG: hypothetical protein RBT80_15690 [Candidatus Vecturithrix sp.]|nr:hypothetical protein [Candidatus Vecturithrix sp.]